MKIEIPKIDLIRERAKIYPEYKTIYTKLPQYVRKILETYRLRPEKVTLLRKGISSFVFRIDSKKRLALKISPRYSLYTEIYFFRKAKASGFPVPRVITVDTTKKLIPHDYYIAEWIKGKTPDEFRERDLYSCALALGRVFAHLHKIRTHGFGYPQLSGKWSHKSWNSALRDFINREVSFGQIKSLFGKKVAKIARQITSDKKMGIKSPVLIHGDAGEDQFIVEKKNKKWKVLGILDPSDFISGDPMADLASAMISWNKRAYRRGFYDGYLSVHKLTKEEKYRLDRLLFLNQIWAASIVHRMNKKDGKEMTREALNLANKFKFLH